MSFKALVYAYLIGGITFIPLVVASVIFYTIYSSAPVNSSDPTIVVINEKEEDGEKPPAPADGATPDDQDSHTTSTSCTVRPSVVAGVLDQNDAPKPRRGWLTVRRTFEESTFDGSYVTLVKSFLDSRSKDPKRSRPKDMWYVALKGKVLYLYEDEAMTECEAAIGLDAHEIAVYPEGLLDGELFARRNAICLKPRAPLPYLNGMPSVTKEMKPSSLDGDVNSADADETKPESLQETVVDEEEQETSREATLDVSIPWFIFVRSNIEMEDWYLSFIHASNHPLNTSTLQPLQPIFDPSDMAHLVETLDEQPDVIPMRWFNALLGRVFFSYYRTHVLEEYLIARLMKKLSKVKRPGFLSDIVVTKISVGNTAPTFSKPMLKELTKEGDTALEVHLHYKGEVRITVEAVATINLGARLKSYSVKLVLAAVLREIEGNLLVKVKRPPSNRVWYAFTQMPRMVLDVEPVVSDRQITWNMVLGAIETRVKEIILESIVIPNMDDIAFSQSSDYHHRGGIWPDAVRREKHTTTDSDSLQLAPTSHSESSTLPSTPSVSVPSPAEEMKAALKRTVSAEEMNKAEPSSVSDTSLTRAATTAMSSNPSSSSTTPRRRTWFSTTVKADSLADGVSESLERGRVDGVTPPSSRSTSSGSDVTDAQEQQNGQLLSPNQPPPLPPRRVSPGVESADNFATTLSISPNPPRIQIAASSSPPSSTSSFFSTLKARAADKQALSNSAKEAMKKWSSNWGTSKREAPDSGHDGTVYDRFQPDSPEYQSKRSSYADIRRNVEDRQKIAIPGDMSVVDNVVNGKGRVVSTPVEGRPQRETRSLSISGGPAADGPSSSQREIPIEPHNFNSDEQFRETELEAPVSLPLHTQPPQPRTMTIPGIHASHRGEVMSMGYVAEPAHSAEIKPKTPGIQSVYRLWKNPASSNQPNNHWQESETEATPRPSGELDTSLQGCIPSSSLPIPPPLPPRSRSATTVSQPAEAPRTENDARDSASIALELIATQSGSKIDHSEGRDEDTVPLDVDSAIVAAPAILT